MHELLLLKALLDREVYLSYRQYITVSKELEPILDSFDLWYRNNSENPTVSDIAVNTPPGYPSEALGRLQSLEKPKDISPLLARVKTAQIAAKLALEAYQLSEGQSTIPKVLALARELEVPDTEELKFVTSDIREILCNTMSTMGLRWRLRFLNQSLGSLRPGDFGMVFARPETGKTTFLASEVTHMATQSTTPILWFNNEEQGQKVKLRCFQASTGMTLSQIRENPSRAQHEYIRNTRDLIQIVDDSTMSASRAEAIVSRVKPSLIVFDQLDKIYGFKSDREDLAMGAIYQWAREIAKTGSPVIGICQASGEAEGEPWLHMGNMANAKTAKQAEADWILGIGKVHTAGHDYIRYFNISKNKLIGDEDSDPAMRHGKQEILIKPDIARYEML